MIAIINSGVANISSVVFALNRLNVEAHVTTDPEVITKATHVILPGVGAAQMAMKNLTALNLVALIPSLTQPVLGICLGMQLMFEHSEEGDVDCLGIFSGEIKKLVGKDLIIPHMGWNTLSLQKQSPLLAGINNESYVYFVHSYCASVDEYTLAVTHYGQDFSAIMQKNNFYAMQFHPERSGVVGEQLLSNFINL